MLYVGVHEMLHALGCEVTGGDVYKLEISPLYGGALYAKWFSFVVTGSEYAGRLSGFETHGSDLIYLCTDFMPFVLTVLFGVTLLKMAGRGRRPIRFGSAVVLGLTPFYNLQGDYFEMGSIITTRLVTFAMRGFGHPPLYEKLRSDDIFKLGETFLTRPTELGLEGIGDIALADVLIHASFVIAILLAFATYWAGHQVSRLWLQR